MPNILQVAMTVSHHIFLHGAVVPMERTVQSRVTQLQVSSASAARKRTPIELRI
jgi:hypothetical protein